MNIQITPDQLRTYNESGYLVLENIFSQEEINSLDELVEIQRKQVEQRLLERRDTEGYSLSNEFLSVISPHEHDERIGAHINKPDLVKIITQFLGSDAELYYSESILKRPHGKIELPWHQDEGYIDDRQSGGLNVWIPLNDATKENGCISVLPGSHTQNLINHWEGPNGLECYSLSEPNQGVKVPVSAGSILIFPFQLIHRSEKNNSDGVLKDFVLQYVITSNTDDTRS